MFNKKFSKEPTIKQKLGEIGENCACEYLKSKGYKVISRNYLKKWGEIDIVAKNKSKLHFVEVKSVSSDLSKVTHETKDGYRPEDNMHPWKLKRLSRVIQSYLLENDSDDEIDWQFDLVTVYIDLDKRLSRVFLHSDLII